MRLYVEQEYVVCLPVIIQKTHVFLLNSVIAQLFSVFSLDEMERSLDFQICQRFHILLWEKAASAYEVRATAGSYHNPLIHFRT